MEYPANLSASEIWFREADLEHLQNKQATVTVRLGNRQNGHCEAKGCYFPGHFVTAKVVLDPQIKQFADWQTKIVITANTLKKWKEITDKDLQGCLPNQDTKDKLKNFLEQAYGRALTVQDLLSVIRFEYKDNLKTAADLVKVGAMSVAKLPPDNPANFEHEHLTVPLIAEDYPAKTPVMWNAAYREFGIPAGNIMLVGNPDQVEHILDILRQDPKFYGGGAGVGFKDTAIHHLDELDPLAEAIGAINFIKKTADGKLKGYNTDGIGYAMSLEQKGLELKDKKIVILGAGGTGNAIAFALAQKGAKLVILNRTVAKAKALAERINAYFKQNLATADGEDLIGQQVEDADVIINVSTKGAQGLMEKCNALVPVCDSMEENHAQAARVMAKIPAKTIISDIVLTKEATPLLQMAQAQNRPTLGGIPMVVNQGVEAFWLLYQDVLKAKGYTKDDVARIMIKASEQK